MKITVQAGGSPPQQIMATYGDTVRDVLDHAGVQHTTGRFDVFVIRAGRQTKVGRDEKITTDMDSLIVAKNSESGQ